MDEQVLKAQRWVNRTYTGVPGYNPCPENGRTGWVTMYSLTRALQHELGIAALSDAFGPSTLSRLIAHGNVGLGSTNMNMRTIAEAALYCKGYSGGGLDGSFNVNTQVGVAAVHRDMGLPEPVSVGNVAPKVLKAMLTMDAYVLLPGGSVSVQSAQRYLNGAYIDRGQFFIGPCDGFFSRNVQRALVYALQYEMGMSDSAVTGSTGPGTREGLRTQATVRAGSQDGGSRGFVRLFHTALVFNGYKGRTGDEARSFTDATAFTVRAFQEFCQLPRTGAGDYGTWMSLLVSTGDPDRQGTAFDCMYPLTKAKIDTVKAAGYRIAGRYLTGGTNKVLTNSEIALIHDNGLSFFPIFQQVGNSLQYFDYQQGRQAGADAVQAARGFGIPYGTVIYFAVDFDAQDAEITSAIIPYFEGVRDAVDLDGDHYAIGVYGCRNVCLRLAAAGLTTRSFVSGMSTGYSGNLGYPLPRNWAFDQIKNFTLAPGAPGAIEIDNDIASGRDLGLNSVTRPRDPNDGFYTYLIWVEARARQWREQGRSDRSEAELAAQFLRNGTGEFDFPFSDDVFGVLDTAFIDFVNTYPGRPDANPLRDPRHLWDVDRPHLGASIGAHITNATPGERTSANLGDFGSWGGDLLSVIGQFTQSGLSDDQAYNFGRKKIATRGDDTFFSLSDFLADVDAYLLGIRCRADRTAVLSMLIKQHHATPASARERFRAYYAERFRSSRDVVLAAARTIVSGDVDLTTARIREGFWIKDFRSVRYPVVEAIPGLIIGPIATAFADVVAEFSA